MGRSDLARRLAQIRSRVQRATDRAYTPEHLADLRARLAAKLAGVADRLRATRHLARIARGATHGDPLATGATPHAVSVDPGTLDGTTDAADVVDVHEMSLAELVSIGAVPLDLDPAEIDRRWPPNTLGRRLWDTWYAAGVAARDAAQAAEGPEDAPEDPP